MRHAAFDAFRNKLSEAVSAVASDIDDAFAAIQLGFVEVAGALEVAFARALRHRGKRTHAAIGLEGAALVEDGFAGAFIDSGKEGADHDGAGAGSNCFGDVAGIFNA